MKTSYIDHADYMEESIQDSFGVMCPTCGGARVIPDEQCIEDCECPDCEGTGEVSAMHAQQIKRNQKQTDYYGN